MIYFIVYLIAVLFVMAIVEFIKKVDKKKFLKPFLSWVPFIVSILVGLLTTKIKGIDIVWYINAIIVFTFSILSYENVEKKLNLISKLIGLFIKDND